MTVTMRCLFCEPAHPMSGSHRVRFEVDARAEMDTSPDPVEPCGFLDVCLPLEGQTFAAGELYGISINGTGGNTG